MKKTSKNLRLDIETIKTLVDRALGEVRGGVRKSNVPTCSCEACNYETGNVTGPGTEPPVIIGRG